MSANTIQSFHLPPYHEIPDVGLYLDQVTRYVTRYLNDSLQPLGQPPVTASMLSNYVKKGYVARPVRKQYFRDQIGYFFFMSLTKQVLPLEHIHTLFTIQQGSYTAENAYENFRIRFESMLASLFFRIRFESMLASLFNESKTPVLYPRDADFGQHMLESAVISAAHRIYLNYCLDNYPVPTENPAGSPGQS